MKRNGPFTIRSSSVRGPCIFAVRFESVLIKYYYILTFVSEENDAVLLVDASNAFNSLNREAALHNIQHLCPTLSTILINCYREATELFVDGIVLYSEEGTTQGDPLAMPMYALATIPLINQLGDPSNIIQVWYADDASAAGASLPFAHGGTNSPLLALRSATSLMPPRHG